MSAKPSMLRQCITGPTLGGCREDHWLSIATYACIVCYCGTWLCIITSKHNGSCMRVCERALQYMAQMLLYVRQLASSVARKHDDEH